jgi:hypothetical protein
MKRKDKDVGNRDSGKPNMSSVDDLGILDTPLSGYIKGMSDYYYHHYEGNVIIVFYVAALDVAYASFFSYISVVVVVACDVDVVVDCVATIVPYFDASFLLLLLIKFRCCCYCLLCHYLFRLLLAMLLQQHIPFATLACTLVLR